MKWLDIITQVRDRLQEQSESFFTNERLMDIARRVHMEIATVTECLEATADRDTEAEIIEYDLPGDCLNVEAATCGGYPLAQVDFRRVHTRVYPVGQPACYYIFGSRIGLYPAPAGVQSLRTWYSQRPSLGGFTLMHSGASGATAATAEVSSGCLALTITDGAHAGSDVLALNAPPLTTIGGLTAAINALNRGWTATRIAGCPDHEPSANLEPLAATSAFQKTMTLDLAVKLPEQFQFLIELGAVYRALWKDTEFEAGEIYRREYVDRLEALRRLYARRHSRSGTRQLRDAYRYPASGAGIRIFIP